jgi:LDH2 family malate/lactate/ureidoglycolate dehydrogenase
MEDSMVKISGLHLVNFVEEVFLKLGVNPENSLKAAISLTSADRRGILSHGIARLSRYIDGIEKGIINPVSIPEVERETPVSALINGNAGLGQINGYFAMEMAIEKAKKNGLSFTVVKNSNHYGIAGFYAMMALEHDLIGFSTTNSLSMVVPTYSNEGILGTNPLAVAVCTDKELPFVLDMSTSTVPRGKIEVFNREGLTMPLSWATDEDGKPVSSPDIVLDNLIKRWGGGLLPLGGADEEEGGHKGFGLAALLDILSGVISGGFFGTMVYGEKNAPSGVSHSFAVIDPSMFIDIQEFKSRMDSFIQMIKKAGKRQGSEKIFIHGEKEYIKERENSVNVTIERVVYEELMTIKEKYGLETIIRVIN